MAVEAVASGVIQKVTDLLIQEPVIFDKVIDQVEDIRIELRQMRGFFIDAEELQHSDECVKKWVQNYLETLYQVEDMVESYVLKLGCKKKGISLIKNYGFYLHGSRARHDICRKMEDINEKIQGLKREKPEKIEDASLRGNSLRQEEEEQPSVGHTTLLSQTMQTSNSSHEDDSSSRELFFRTLEIDNDSVSHHYFTLYWDKIRQKCKGSPLNLEFLGGLLSTKIMANEEWAQLFSHSDWHRSDIWLLSYNDLPAHYKLCLLYLALFPKEFNVSTRRILRLWLAEGFLRLSPDSPGLSEDLAEECFNYLVKRKFIKISKFRSDGGPKKCHLPGFLHENLSPKAQEISLFYIHQKSEAESKIPNKTSGIRRMVEYADIKDFSEPDSILENLRSYLSFKFSRYDTPTVEVGNFLRKIIGKKGFGLLRVLDLEGVYKPMLPASLKHLFQLRYLGLRNTFLDKLPESVGNLPYLETLDLKRTYINNIPSSIWKLEHLRHLNLPQIRLDIPVQQLRSTLLTIWGLVIDDACYIEGGLSQWADLRELGITCQLKQFDELMNWIASLTRLQSLSLISKDEMGQPFDLTLEPLQDLCKLSHLKLLGKLSHLLTKDQFPQNLKVLTLSLSQLNEDPMSVLSQLPGLSVLRLLAKSYVGKKMHCPQNNFKNLRVLKLWMLEELEEWTVERGGMPNIRELNIRCCHKLKELPLELLRRTTLEELVLTTHKPQPCMPQPCMPELEQHVTRNKSGRTTSTINRYDFSLLPWEKDADLWNKSSDEEITQV